jgi:hypothetical protein
MARFEVFIPATEPDGMNLTLRVTADTWMAALKVGLKKIGDAQGLPNNVLCDIQDDESIHVTDSRTERVFRIQQIPEVSNPGLAAAPKGPWMGAASAPPSSPIAAAAQAAFEVAAAQAAAAQAAAQKAAADRRAAEQAAEARSRRERAEIERLAEEARAIEARAAAIAQAEQEAAEQAAAERMAAEQAAAEARAAAARTAAERAAAEARAIAERSAAERAAAKARAERDAAQRVAAERAAAERLVAERETQARAAAARAVAEALAAEEKAQSQKALAERAAAEAQATAQRARRDEKKAKPAPVRIVAVEKPKHAPPATIGRPAADPEEAAKMEEALADLFERTAELFQRPPDDALYYLLDLAMEKIPVDAGTVYVADLNRRDLTFAAVRGPMAAQLLALKPRVQMGKGFVGFCAQEGVAVAISDAQRDRRFLGEISKKLGYETRSMITTPIVHGGRTLGAIQLINKKGSSSFTQGELSVLHYLAHQGALLLEARPD